jgi:quinol monooxygenase YgiN
MSILKTDEKVQDNTKQAQENPSEILSLKETVERLTKENEILKQQLHEKKQATPSEIFNSREQAEKYIRSEELRKFSEQIKKLSGEPETRFTDNVFESNMQNIRILEDNIKEFDVKDFFSNRTSKKISITDYNSHSNINDLIRKAIIGELMDEGNGKE